VTIARRATLVFAVLLVGSLLAPGAVAEPTGRVALAPPIDTEVPPPMPVVDGYYGKAVAIDGDRLLVGAPLDDLTIGATTYFAVGAAWLFEWTGSAWEGTRIMPPYWVDEDDNYQYYGESVGLDGDTFVVGAWMGDGQETGSGTAWVHRLVGGVWVESELEASDGILWDWFGKSVAVSGDRVVVGAPTSDVNEGVGAAYVYERDGVNWVETKLTLTGAAGSDRPGLGNSGVAVDGETVVIGAPQGSPYGWSEEGEGTGRVHVFTKSGDVWVEQVLAPVGVSMDDTFGWSVAIDGDRIVVGAPGDDGNGSGAGAAYVFEKSAGVWLQTKKLTDSVGGSGDTYGYGVGVSGDRISIGAPGRGTGTIYWYTGSGGTWRALDSVARYDSSPALGWAVDVDGNRIAAGAPFYNTDGKEDAGTAVVLEFLTCDGRTATLVGTDDSETLVGTLKNDVIVGLGGDDTISGLAGSDFICAGDGDDQVDGGDGNDRVFGEAGNDVLFGGGGNDLLSGGLGHDEMTGGAGDDTLNGGRGADTIDFSDAPVGVTINLNTKTASGHGSDRITRCEHIFGSDFDDVITGHGGKNRISGLDGSDIINGGDRRDLLTGGRGDDRLFGGTGNDALAGNAGDDFLKGQDGNDSLKGGTGNDELYGGEGTDSVPDRDGHHGGEPSLADAEQSGQPSHPRLPVTAPDHLPAGRLHHCNHLPG